METADDRNRRSLPHTPQTKQCLLFSHSHTQSLETEERLAVSFYSNSLFSLTEFDGFVNQCPNPTSDHDGFVNGPGV